MAFGIKTLLITLRNSYIASDAVQTKQRAKILHRGGYEVSPNSLISSHVELLGNNITIEQGVFINRHVTIDASGAEIIIGKNVHIAQNTLLLTRSHQIGEHPELRCGEFKDAPLHIGKGAWVGANVTVLPGAHIAEGCVIAAGAVVANPTEPNGVYAGVPARRIKELPA